MYRKPNNLYINRGAKTGEVKVNNWNPSDFSVTIGATGGSSGIAYSSPAKGAETHEIDWSKAPKGAEYAGFEPSGRLRWYKDVKLGESYKYWCGGWRTSEGFTCAGQLISHPEPQRVPEEKHKEDWCEVGKVVEVKSTGSVNKILRVSDDDGVLLDSGIWRCRTELRPYKEPEPQWVPGESLPPAGTECILDTLGRSWRNERVIITYIGDGVGCYRVVETGMEYSFSAADATFKAIQSHRDKVIEAAISIAKDQRLLGKDGYASVSDVDLINRLYDAGMLKLPEGE